MSKLTLFIKNSKKIYLFNEKTILKRFIMTSTKKVDQITNAVSTDYSRYTVNMFSFSTKLGLRSDPYIVTENRTFEEAV